jgi:hypothetical protein
MHSATSARREVIRLDSKICVLLEEIVIREVDCDVLIDVTHRQGAVIVSENLGLFAFAAGFFALWIVLNKWVLPRFGVKT